MGHPVEHEGERFTYGDYIKWPEEERWELIEGVAYSMTPAPSTAHQRILGELQYEIHGFLKGKPCEAFVAPFDVRLPEEQERDEEITTVVQPDIAVVCDPKKLDDKGCRGAPDFIIEILLPSNVSKDLIHKTALYERHGVKEYWLVHPADRIVTVYLLGENGRYGPPRYAEAKGHLAVATLPGLEIDLEAVFAPPHQAQTQPGT